MKVCLKVSLLALCCYFVYFMNVYSKVDFVAFDDVTLTRSKEVSNFVGDHFHAEKRQTELGSKYDVTSGF